MYKIYGEVYCNDFTRKNFEMRFSSLDDIYRYMERISRGFNSKYSNWFKSENKDYSENSDEISYISARSYEHGRYESFWIKKIENENGIVFSDGEYTKNQKFCSKKVNQWLSECQHRMKNSKPNFVED